MSVTYTTARGKARYLTQVGIAGCALWTGAATSWALHSPLGQVTGCDPKQGGATGWTL